jgi:replication fork protection complex subunit Tof1/Swi1
LRSVLAVIDQFLATPYDFDGKKASALVRKSRRRRRRRSPSVDAEKSSDEDEPMREKKQKKKKEKEIYKSAVLIEDSDEEYGDIEAFLEKEKQLRERMARAATEGGIGTMKPTGTKKRRKRTETGVGKKRKGNDKSALATDGNDDGVNQSDQSGGDVFSSRNSSQGAPSPSRPRPRPQPRMKPPALVTASTESVDDASSTDDRSPNKVDLSPVDVELVASSPKSIIEVGTIGKARRKRRLVISDDEE